MSNNYEYIDENTNVTVFNGDKGEKIVRLVIIPLSKNPGSIQLQDGSDTPFTVYVGEGDLSAIDVIETTYLDLQIKANNEGGWGVLTGDNIACIVIGE